MEDRMSDDVIDSEIARYRARMTAEAELAAGDLDEIEDHLRRLTVALREAGMPAATAVTEAARRLGEPAALAREHARVRSPFGARLSRARAWSALVPLAILFAWDVSRHLDQGIPLWSPALLLPFVSLAAFAARLSWARAVVLGALTFNSISLVSWLVVIGAGATPEHVAMLGLTVSATVFVVPWRRSEIAPPGIALALLVWTFLGVSAFGALSSLASRDLEPLVLVAWFGAVVASCGIVLRARWSAVVAAVASISLAGGMAVLAGSLSPELPIVIAQVLAGAVAAAAAAVIAWRTARSGFGTFAAVLR
jgi:hypothetical protein